MSTPSSKQGGSTALIKSGNRIVSREPTYQAAETVAPIVEAHFTRQLSAARERGEQELAPAPDARTIQSIVDATFWASLRREEGRAPQISLAYLPPEQAEQPLIFEHPLSLTPGILTKLAPAVERPGIHLGVWRKQEELYVWGATRAIPSFGFVVEAVQPGLMVIKHRRIDGFGKFANVAVLKGDQVKVVDEQAASLPDCPDLVTSLLGFTSPTFWSDSLNVLVQLAASMRAHAHGGSLLVVPSGAHGWRDSIVHPIQYSVVPAFSWLTELMQRDASERGENGWQTAVRRAVESIAGLTAVDGATVIDDQYRVLAFGAKIRRREGTPPVERMVATEPVLGNQPIVVHPGQSGGTRHLSAAQFVNDQHDALALVASQDGRFTIFAWSPCEGMVHAHRVDALLL